MKALELKPDRVEAVWNASLAQLTLGNFREGWKNYEIRWRKDETEPHRREFKVPLWLGEQDIAGRTILLHPEQGLGDIFQFVRYASLLARRGAKVILEVQPSQKSLLADVAGIIGIYGRGEKLPDFDLHCPLMSLPLAFGRATIPAGYRMSGSGRSRLNGGRACRSGRCGSGLPGRAARSTPTIAIVRSH